ncbi:MAG: hypothetical protein ACXWWR_07460 [Candidatus Limnocylindrales bacterium]
MPHDASPRIRRARPSHLLARLILSLVLIGGSAAALPAAQVDATWSPRPPTGEYTPHRVWQMKKNCVWAAGAMLLDKWTHGGSRVSQSVLRRASHDKKGGSSLYDLSRGVAAVTGIRMRFSPGYGDTMTWWQLLDRLDHDGGAVLIGEYGRLPAHFTRWSTSFANRRNSSHAVYIQSYDRVHGKVWLMDPLAEGHYRGEWIGVEDLHRYATIEDGKVMAAATPARHQPRTAPLTDRAYRLTSPRLAVTAVAGSTVKVSVGLSISAGFPNPAAHRFVARWVPVVTRHAPRPPTRSRAVIDTVPSPGSALPPPPVEATTVSAADRAGSSGFNAAVPVPAIPGRYRLSLGLAEVGRKTPSRTFRSVEVEVVDPFAAAISLPALSEVTAGESFSLKVGLANIGSLDWRPPVIEHEGPRPVAPATQTVFVLTWRTDDGSELPAAELPAELAPGQTIKLNLVLVAPPQAGVWNLAVDVVNLERGALSSTGRDLPMTAVIVDPMGLSAEP